MKSVFLIVPLLLVPVGACAKKPKTTTETGAAYKKLENPVVERSTDDGLIVVEVDINEDGRADIFNYYRPRTSDRLLVRKELDINLDGRIDVISRFGDTGELEREELDQDFDGKFDWVDHYQHGARVYAEHDTNYDGRHDVFIYYEKGKPVRKERDTNHDPEGAIDFWERFDEAGNVIRTGADTDGDHKVDVREE